MPNQDSESYLSEEESYDRFSLNQHYADYVCPDDECEPLVHPSNTVEGYYPGIDNKKIQA